METASRHYISDALSDRWPYLTPFPPTVDENAVVLPLLVRGVEKQVELLKKTTTLELDDRIQVLDNLIGLANDAEYKHRILQQDGIKDLLVSLLADGVSSEIRSRTALLLSELFRSQYCVESLKLAEAETPNNPSILSSLAQLLCSGDHDDAFGVPAEHEIEHQNAAKCFRVLCEMGRTGCETVAGITPSIFPILIGPALRSSRSSTTTSAPNTDDSSDADAPSTIPSFAVTPSTPRDGSAAVTVMESYSLPQNALKQQESPSVTSVCDILICLTCLTRTSHAIALRLIHGKIVAAAAQFIAPSPHYPQPLIKSRLHTIALGLVHSLAAIPTGQQHLVDLGILRRLSRVLSTAVETVMNMNVSGGEGDADAENTGGGVGDIASYLPIDSLIYTSGALSLVSTQLEAKSVLCDAEVLKAILECSNLYYKPPPPKDQSQMAQNVLAALIEAGENCASAITGICDHPPSKIIIDKIISKGSK